MSHRRGFPKASASARTQRRWKKRILDTKSPRKYGMLKAWESINGVIKID